MKLVGERRALAAIVFAFYFILFVLLGMNPELPPGMNRPIFALAGVYGMAFFTLVAGYFWARWYAVGVGLFGLIVAMVLTWQAGQLVNQFVFFGATHLAATLMLWGSGMSDLYDGKTEWRERFHMDESAVQRLGRSVIRAGVSLPMVLIYGLAPKQPGGLAVSVGVLLLVGFGMRALVRMRTWGVLAIGTAGAVMLTMAVTEIAASREAFALQPALAGSLLIFAATPWAAPALRFLRGR